MRVGYALAFVASSGSNGAEPVVDVPLDVQIAALTTAGCARIHTDSLSEAGTVGKGLEEALAFVQAGDTLVVWRLDRVSQSPQVLMETIAALHEKGVDFVSLSEGTEIVSADSKLVCTNFAALAEFPRTVARARAAEPKRHQPPWQRHAGLIAAAVVVGVSLLYLLCFMLVPRFNQYTGRVVGTHVISSGANGVTQTVTVLVTSGKLSGKRFTVNETYAGIWTTAYATGDNVLLGADPTQQTIFINNYDRRGSTFALLLIFFGLIILVAKRQGMMALAGMGFSVLVILFFVVPHILQGGNPLWYASLAALPIIPVSYYLAHGLHRKTTVAILSTFVTLALTFLLAFVFAHLLRVPFIQSGDEGSVFFAENGTLINVQHLYLAAILIGSLAVLNDITISQASIVTSLYQANAALTLRQLFTHAMDVGKDHVASLINTLLLVYIGASFTLVLNSVQSMANGTFDISNPNFSADLLRTVVVSIAIVMAVPISTYMAAYLTIHKRL